MTAPMPQSPDCIGMGCARSPLTAKPVMICDGCTMLEQEEGARAAEAAAYHEPGVIDFAAWCALDRYR